MVDGGSGVGAESISSTEPVFVHDVLGCYGVFCRDKRVNSTNILVSGDRSLSN